MSKYEPDDEIILVYDGECPACRNYLRILRIRESVSKIRIVNAREEDPILKDIAHRGLDIDNGMVIKIGDNFYYGADAINKIALLSSRSSIFNKINYFIFKSKTLSKLLYPVLVAGRSLLLKVLGIRKIGG